MAMTNARKAVYKKGWWRRESNVDRRNRRRELNKRIRRSGDLLSGNYYRKITSNFETMS